MTNAEIVLLIYLLGDVVTFAYAMAKGVCELEAMLVATLSWVGLFFFGLRIYKAL